MSTKRIILLRARGFDLDVDRNRLTDSRDGFGALAEHQIEFTAFDGFRRYGPTRLFRVVGDGTEQFHMQRDRSRDAMHGKIAENVATLLASLLHAVALERDFRKLCDVKKFRTTQVIVAFFDSRVDAADIDSGRD